MVLDEFAVGGRDGSMTIPRRKVLLDALFGAGWLGLRSLATGVPLAVLADPRKASAQTAPVPTTSP